MPFPVEQISPNPRIPIPPDLPEILKQFTKAAIRTQPKDVLQWAAAYFRALATGDRPPIKERIEFTSNDNSSWVTLGLLRVLHRQLGDKEYVSAIHIQSNWDGLCLDPKKFTEITEAGGFANRIPWLTFLAFICSLATPDILSALQLFCEVVTEEPEGCAAKVPFKILSRAYRSIISRYDQIKEDDANKFLQYLADCSETHGGFVHPGMFRSPACPQIT